MAYVTQIDSEVIAELKGAKAISMTDADDIKAEMADYAKVSKLISAIMRRSNYSYVSFQEVLRKTLQLAAADFLSEGKFFDIMLSYSIFFIDVCDSYTLSIANEYIVVCS